MSDKSYVDLDGPKAETEEFSGYEIELNFQRLFAPKGVKMAIVNDSSEANVAGCNRSTLVKKEVLFLTDLTASQSFCIGTSEHKWAIMNIIGHTESGFMNSSEIDFSVKLGNQ